MPEPAKMDEQTRAMIISGAFPRASMKREIMCRRLETLRRAVERGDVDDIQVALGDFLMEARSLHDVIKSEGASMNGFRAWWKKRWTDLMADPLMKWANDARVGDFHRGIPSIEVIGWEVKGGFEIDPSQLSDTTNLVMKDGGAFIYSMIGTPTERIQRGRITGDKSMVLHIHGLSITEGAPQSVDDLPALCEKIVRRNQELLHEVKVTLSGPASGE